MVTRRWLTITVRVEPELKARLDDLVREDRADHRRGSREDLIRRALWGFVRHVRPPDPSRC